MLYQIIKTSFAAMVGILMLVTEAAFAQESSEPPEEGGSEIPLRLLGGSDYENSCASCHGLSGRGNGPVAEFLALIPADLTKLAHNNGGVFPEARVAEIVDGRKQVKVHGPRDMPVWGDWFNADAEAPGVRASEREVLVRKRIDALIAYLKTIQVN